MILIGVTAISIPTILYSSRLISEAKIQWGDDLPLKGAQEPLRIKLELMYADGGPIEAPSPVARYSGAGGPVLGINANEAIPLAMGTELLWNGSVYPSEGSLTRSVDLGLFYFVAKDGCDEIQGRSCYTMSSLIATTKTDSDGRFGFTGNLPSSRQELFAWNLPRGVVGEVIIVYVDLLSATFQDRIKTHYAVKLTEPPPILGIWVNGQQIINFGQNIGYVSDNSGVVTFRFELRADQPAYFVVGSCGNQGCLKTPPQRSLIFRELTPAVTEYSLTLNLDPSYYVFYVLTSPADPFKSILQPNSVLVFGTFDTLNVLTPSEYQLEYQLLGLVPLAVGFVLLLSVPYEMMSEHWFIVRRIRTKIHHAITQTPLKTLIMIAIFSRVFVFALAVFTASIFGEHLCHYCWNIGFPFLNLFSRWDSGYYADIAVDGYSNLIAPQWEFFPGYPILMGILGRLLTVTTHMPLNLAVHLAGFVVSNFAFFGSIFYLYKLSVAVLRNAKLAYYSVLFLAFYPAGVFLSATYSDSLFLMLTLGSLYYWRVEVLNKSAMLGFFAALTRPVGILLVVPYLYVILMNRSRRTVAINCLPVMSILLGFLSFMAFSQLMTGTPFATFAAERLYWGVTLNLQNILVSAKRVILANPIIIPYLALGIGGVITSILTVKSKAEAAIDVYALGLLTTYIFAPLISLPRYTITLVPAYWGFARWSQHAGTGRLVFAVFLILLAIATGLFVNWYSFY
jgi:hypothetical protein